MGDVIGNTIAMVFFGLLLGFVLQVSALFMPRRRGMQTRKPGESYSSYIQRIAKQEDKKAAMQKMSRPAWISMAIFYALIAMLVLLIKFSPLQMNWLAFLLSFFAGFGVLQWIFQRAQAGKLQVKRDFFFDITPDQEPPNQSDQVPPSP